MNSPILQLLVLAGIAVFLILRLKNVLGTREGFEKPAVPRQADVSQRRPDLSVIEGGPDRDITDHVDEGSESAQALAAMKRLEPHFSVSEFIQGARGAYEMILLGFERGELADIKPFLSEEVYETFAHVVEARHRQGLSVEAEFMGVRETALVEAELLPGNIAEITVRFVGELVSVVRDSAGEIVEGTPNTPKKQRDVWTFARTMGTDDPNWQLVATGG
ncbi:Predicted lipid-binding transport protein, Tim44 family [Thalassovita litoralis]|jgi:predicted lipid-binding transport protein (Tim44 family)|uniref:Predicted lipid-binding transport protein, Tim44 family n=1 Tax=Thalassovita litoralis TaxID=1010611 RepID=A0A521AY07_9RHOB|nr:Tim44/TimA family putative adaptor protein [Thalassovita litoralis]SMO39733.1 Predicted lipid-binding transport protein, Tim44 family [Thalassovita litoralis]